MTDCVQYEKDFIIKTQTVHSVPQVWHSPVVGQGRAKDYHIHRRQAADDSYSSDNNAAGDLWFLTFGICVLYAVLLEYVFCMLYF